MQIHEKLKYYIDTYHYNRSALANAINIKPSTLSMKLDGHRKLTADEFVDLCCEMGVDCKKIAAIKVPEQKPKIQNNSQCTALVAVK